MVITSQSHNVVQRVIYLGNKYLDRVILFFLPLILAFINSNWIFTPATNNMPDPWFYFAYFRYFFKYAPTFPSNIHYFVERLTWNVPGYFVYSLFSPLVANYVLHLTVYYVAAFSLYGTLYLLFDQRTAFLGALLMGSYPWFLRAVGWDYPDGTGIAHLILLIFLLTLALRVDYWRTLVFLAGIIHASLLITNPFWVGFFPSWGVYFLLLNNEKKVFGFKELVQTAGYFLLGNVLTVIVCGIFYYWVTGKFFFLEQSLNISVRLTHNAANNTGVMTNYGQYPPYWHILPLILTIVSLLSLWSIFTSKNRRDKNLLTFLGIFLMFILSYAWLIFWHYFSNPMLIMFPYSSFVIPATFMLLGGLIADSVSRLSEKQFQITTSLVIGTLLAPGIALNIFPYIEKLQGNNFLISLFAVTLLLALAVSTRKQEAIISLLIFESIFYLTADNSFVYLADRFKGQNNFQAVISASQNLDAYYPNHSYNDFRLWFRSDRNYNTFFSLAAVYLYPWGSSLDSLVSSRKPHNKLSLSPADHIQLGDNIVVVSSSAHSLKILKEANQALSGLRLKLLLEKSETIEQGSIRFYLYFNKVVSLDTQ